MKYRHGCSFIGSDDKEFRRPFEALFYLLKRLLCRQLSAFLSKSALLMLKYCRNTGKQKNKAPILQNNSWRGFIKGYRIVLPISDKTLNTEAIIAKRPVALCLWRGPDWRERRDIGRTPAANWNLTDQSSQTKSHDRKTSSRFRKQKGHERRQAKWYWMRSHFCEYPLVDVVFCAAGGQLIPGARPGRGSHGDLIGRCGKDKCSVHPGIKHMIFIFAAHERNWIFLSTDLILCDMAEFHRMNWGEQRTRRSS